MDSLLGTFSPVNPEEFHEFNSYLASELERCEMQIAADVAELERWLGSPPADATESEIHLKLYEWDEARQWLDAVCCKLYGEWREELRRRELESEIRMLSRQIDDLLMDDPRAQVSALFDHISDLEEQLHALKLDELCGCRGCG